VRGRQHVAAGRRSSQSDPGDHLLGEHEAPQIGTQPEAGHQQLSEVVVAALGEHVVGAVARGHARRDLASLLRLRARGEREHEGERGPDGDPDRADPMPEGAAHGRSPRRNER
jgi:hypothetical protein